MVINISVQYNGGILPDVILLTQGYYHWGTRLNTMKWLCIYSLCLKKNLNAPRPSEHPPVRGKKCQNV